MTIRAVPITRTPVSELVPLEEIAERLEIHTDTVRRWIKADMADGGNRVPGSRGEGSRYIVIRAVFERAMRDGREPEPRPVYTAPDLTDLRDHLRQRAADDLALADRITAAIETSRKAS